MHLGAMEIVLLILLIVLIFGAKKIPELARSLGRASQEYKKAKEDFLAEVSKPAEDIKDAIASDPSAGNKSAEDVRKAVASAPAKSDEAKDGQPSDPAKS